MRTRRGSRTRGFRAALAPYVDTDLGWCRVLPDAFLVRPGYVVVFEVEDTHRVDAAKLSIYARLWRELANHEVDLELKIIDIRGGCLDADLEAIYLAG